MAKKHKRTSITLSTIAGYSLLKLSQSKIDPYTRATIGITVGAGLFLSQNPIIRYMGIGVSIAGALQVSDVLKGGRLISNEAISHVYVLHETKGIIKLKPNENPDYNIDGFTYKGLNGVFKLSDGIYAKIISNNAIKVLGVGGLVNKITGAGFKTKRWALMQPDKRWHELYMCSV